jgi:protein-arginine deiminase
MSGVTLNLYATEEDANRFSIYRKNPEGRLDRILGKAPRSSVSPIELSPPLNPEGEHYFIEAHEYPSQSFEGLLTVELFMTIPAIDNRGDRLIGRDRVVFRVAPWIMTPNTLPVERVYACKITTSGQDETDEDKVLNSAFLEGLEEAFESLGSSDLLEIIPPMVSRSDPWIQDEVEFGFSQSPTHILPVVCDSPRDRGLDDFPELELRGPDFGHFQIGGSSDNSLDSFGNLEVSPPVTVGEGTVEERHYPLGRIIFGGSHYGVYGQIPPRRMMLELRKFLHAQKVQSPIEIFTDWLHVGHVDEILSFVPADNEKEFKLLLASPSKAGAVLQGLSETGHGSAVLFEGMEREDSNGSYVSAEITVDELLDQTEFWDTNAHFQELIDLNREILKGGLGLDDADVFAIPVLFSGRKDEWTGAFFPNMVNHLVVGRTSIVPKPYGPVIEGEDGRKVDAFEKAFRETLPERRVRFIDDWYSYHQQKGEVHCGTNARRTPFSGVRWWEHRPEGAYDL